MSVVNFIVLFSLSTLLLSSSLSVSQRVKSKSEFLSSLTSKDTDKKVVENLLDKLISTKPFVESDDKGYITQPPGTSWRIIWAPHIRLLESFIFWNTFITTNLTVVYNFGENAEILTSAKYELKILNNPPFHSGNLNTKGKFCMTENGTVCKIVFDHIWVDFQKDKVIPCVSLKSI
jgi:hypothetical protein